MPDRSAATFEQALQRLETLVARLESGDDTLEAALAAYEEGMTLVHACREKLDAAQARILHLQLDPDDDAF